jgi:outer membrane immunogenic protein
MKKTLLMTVAFAALGMAPAVAADLAPRMYTKAPPAPLAPIYNWTGFYIGAMGGYAKEDSGDFGVKGGFGGGTLGYNWQTDKFVFGIEADAAAADISSGIVVPGSPFPAPSPPTPRSAISAPFEAASAWSSTRSCSTAPPVLRGRTRG